jgi:hypothetical protein
MNLSEKCLHRKVVNITEYYNFGFGRFAIRGHLKISNFKFKKFKHSFSWINDFKWKVNYKIDKLYKMYNFHFCCFSLRGHLKILNLSMWGLQTTFCVHRLFQITKFWTAMFHIISRSIRLLVISPSKVIWKTKKNWILKCENFEHNLRDLNDFKWKCCQLQSCITLRGIQL